MMGGERGKGREMEGGEREKEKGDRKGGIYLGFYKGRKITF